MLEVSISIIIVINGVTEERYISTTVREIRAGDSVSDVMHISDDVVDQFKQENPGMPISVTNKIVAPTK